MRRMTLPYITMAVALSILTWHSTSCSAEIKTLQEFQNSLFIKKYSQSKPMESWPLKAGGYSNSFTFDLKIDKNSLVFLEILTNSKDNPTIYRYSMIFHAGYTKQMKSFFYDFFSTVDSSVDSKAVNDYIQKQAAVKLRKSSDAPKKTFGKYSVRVGNVLNAVTISIDKGS